jgi:hypothetical protein
MKPPPKTLDNFKRRRLVDAKRESRKLWVLAQPTQLIILLDIISIFFLSTFHSIFSEPRCDVGS